MAAEKIGDATCPLCRAQGARVSLSKSRLAVLTCNACNLQLFSRSGRSDELVRAYITKAAPAAAPAPVAAPEPEALPNPQPAPAPAARPRLGLFTAWSQ